MARIRSFRNRIQEYETLYLISLIPLLDDSWCFQQCITKERTVQGVLGVPHGPRKEAQPGSKFGCDFKMELIMLACCLLRDEIAHSCLQLFGNSGFCYVPQGPLLILNLRRAPPGLGRLNIVWTQHRDGWRGINSQKTTTHL